MELVSANFWLKPCFYDWKQDRYVPELVTCTGVDYLGGFTLFQVRVVLF